MGTYNKIIINDEVILDLSSDTIATNNLLEGVTAHDATGMQITGKIKKYNKEYIGNLEILEPIAYSYNGIIMPKLPEWDKTAYPYAVIAGDSNGNFAWNPTRLILSNVPLLYGRAVVDWSLFYGSADGACIGYEWSNLNDDGVVTYEPGFVRDENLDRTFSAGGGTADSMVMRSLLWANYDVYKNPSGTELVLATCNDPIPIYE